MTDASNLEQVSIVLRFVNRNNDTRGKFLEFKPVECVTAYLCMLRKNGLVHPSFKARAMMGPVICQQAKMVCRALLLSSRSLLDFYIHCNCHVLNIVIITYCNLPAVRNMAGMIKKLSIISLNFLPNVRGCSQTSSLLKLSIRKINKLKN